MNMGSLLLITSQFTLPIIWITLGGGDGLLNLSRGWQGWIGHLRACLGLCFPGKNRCVPKLCSNHSWIVVLDYHRVDSHGVCSFMQSTTSYITLCFSTHSLSLVGMIGDLKTALQHIVITHFNLCSHGASRRHKFGPFFVCLSSTGDCKFARRSPW